MANNIHQLRVTLLDVEPPVWRTIAVSSDISLGELAAILEGAMGWMGTHLHPFAIDEHEYGYPDSDAPEEELDENQYRLGEVLPNAGDEMRWLYDFGDGWEHTVVVEAVGPARPAVQYPICLAGHRACPPEDCGGPYGYARMLEIVANPSHEEHAQWLEWAPPGFDPERFDIEAANLAIRSPRPVDGW